MKFFNDKRIRLLAQSVKNRRGYRRFSQTGEDSILFDLFQQQRGRYLDIGANHPIIGSNSYLLYREEWDGIAADPLSEFELMWKVFRKRDDFHSVAVGQDYGKLEIVSYENHLRTTGNQSLINHYSRTGRRGQKLLVELVPTRDLLPTSLLPSELFVLFIDVEGMELQVLRGIDFSRQKPMCIVIEDIVALNSSNSPIDTFLKARGYQRIAFTGLSSIYLASESTNFNPLQARQELINLVL